MQSIESLLSTYYGLIKLGWLSVGDCGNLGKCKCGYINTCSGNKTQGFYQGSPCSRHYLGIASKCSRHKKSVIISELKARSSLQEVLPVLPKKSTPGSKSEILEAGASMSP